MNIIKGKIARPQKVVIYGTEGVGKSTLAAQFPSPLFIDVEGGTHQLAVDRTPAPETYDDLLAMIGNIPEDYGTLVIDTIDWTERLIIDHICKAAKKDGLEDFGYGKGYTWLEEEYSRFLDTLSVISKRMNVVLLAHSLIRKFELPDQQGAFDKYELKLSKKCAPLTKEWADMLLFMNFYTVVSTDTDTKKTKAVGGKERVLYTSHSATHDAKNRHGLADMIPAEFASLAAHIPAGNIAPVATSVSQPVGAESPAPAEAPAPVATTVSPAVANALPGATPVDPISEEQRLTMIFQQNPEKVIQYLQKIGWLKNDQTLDHLSEEQKATVKKRLRQFLSNAGLL